MSRGDGLRVQLSPIQGVTKGRTKALLTPQFRFQCPPLDALAITYGHNHQRGTNYQGAETITRTKKRLVSIPMRTLIVEWGYFVVENRWDLEDMRDAFAEIAQEGFPFRLLATHKYSGAAEIDIPAVLEAVTITEQANEPDARYLDLTFTEKDDLEVSRRTNRRSGPARDYPYTISLKKDGRYTATSRAFKTQGEPLTLAVIARYAYGAPSLASFLGAAQRPPIDDWGPSSPLIGHSRFKGGGKITVPEPPARRTERGATVPRTPPRPGSTTWSLP